MSAFDDRFEVAFSALLGELGDDITYTPKGEDVEDVETTAVFRELPIDLQQDPDAIMWLRHAEVKVPASVVTAPAKGETITIDSVVWTIAYIQSSDGGVFTLHCTRPEEQRRVRAGEVLWR